jgi:gluconate 2-dehydrogenase alpha chain
MSTSTNVINEPPADVVVLGLGVTGGIVATELAMANYKVVGIEKGPYWNFNTDFAPVKYDEWGIGFHRKFDHPLPMSTYTIRNNDNQYALAARRNTSLQIIVMGHGVGGMAQHYAGAMGRYGPWNYQMKSETASRYGPNFLNTIDPTNDVQDWPMTYNEYEPYYVEWEKAWGLTGTNQGPLVPTSANYPMPPHPQTEQASMFQSTAEALNYSPYPTPNSLASQAYMNQYGVSVNGCVYDGWCGAACNYVCEVGAKANSAFRVIPAAIASGNFTMKTNSYAFRLDTDSTGKIIDVRYYDASGNVHVQPGKVFWNGLWGFNIPRLMQLSDIGQTYNPTSGSGTIGRGVTATGTVGGASASGSLPIGGNSYSAGNASGGGVSIYDFADDNFDHTGLNFIGGGVVSVGGYQGGGPANFSGIAGSATINSMGSTYKASLKNHYLPTKLTVSLGPAPAELADTRWHLDLDPHHNDIYGDPLERITMDWANNAVNGASYLAPLMEPILTRLGATNITLNKGTPAGTTHMDNWQAHTRGGCRIGSDPLTSVFNMYQQAWTTPNLFAGGEITNTHGSSVTAGTHAIGPTTYVGVEGIKKYLANPGPLV